MVVLDSKEKPTSRKNKKASRKSRNKPRNLEEEQMIINSAPNSSRLTSSNEIDVRNCLASFGPLTIDEPYLIQ